MNRLIYFVIGLFGLIVILGLYATKVQAGGPWHDQYCDIEVT